MDTALEERTANRFFCGLFDGDALFAETENIWDLKLVRLNYITTIDFWEKFLAICTHLE
ncbi:MAG: hypothetical protein GY820_15895 [Gammaproteobacteria bacterium]|nr:hypothetical protein [Gammaproteobacteria bacterium]